MKITVKYIPLSKIKTGPAVPMTERLRQLRSAMYDCMHLLIVRRNEKDGSYRVVGGMDRYEYFKQQSQKRYAPCLVEEKRTLAELNKKLHLFRNSKEAKRIPPELHDLLFPASWSIIRLYMRQVPRYRRLTPVQQLRIFLIAVRYKKTVVSAMKAKTEEWLAKPE